MGDYSKSALGGRGQEQQEKMRVYLGCVDAPPRVDTYDFSKGTVRFEYKHSALHERNKSSKQWRSGPTKTWAFQNLRGASGKKDYDYLILEGAREGPGEAEVFLIRFEELKNTYPDVNNAWVTVPMTGSLSRLRRFSRFVWEHQVSKEDLKSWCDALSQARVTKPRGNSEPQGRGQLGLAFDGRAGA
jgi:hypothetical protein